jgi:hypothetical protein
MGTYLFGWVSLTVRVCVGEASASVGEWGSHMRGAARPRPGGSLLRFPRSAGHGAYAASGGDIGVVKPCWSFSYSSGGR